MQMIYWGKFNFGYNEFQIYWYMFFNIDVFMHWFSKSFILSATPIAIWSQHKFKTVAKYIKISDIVKKVTNNMQTDFHCGFWWNFKNTFCHTRHNYYLKNTILVSTLICHGTNGIDFNNSGTPLDSIHKRSLHDICAFTGGVFKCWVWKHFFGAERQSTTHIKILQIKGGIEVIRCDHVEWLQSWCDSKYLANPQINLLWKYIYCHREGKLTHFNYM